MRALDALNDPSMADVRSSGVGATAPHGHPTEMDPDDPIPTLTARSRRRPSWMLGSLEGSDYIEIIYEDDSEFGGKVAPMPSLSPDTIRALVAAAHRRGKLVVIHVQTEAQARTAIEAGVDGLAHLFVGGGARRLRQVRARPSCLRRAHAFGDVPALRPIERRRRRRRQPADAADFPEFTAMLKQKTGKAALSCVGTDTAVKELLDAHVPILVGTDAPVPGRPMERPPWTRWPFWSPTDFDPDPGADCRHVSPGQGVPHRGPQPMNIGKRADLLLVKGDPTADIDAVKNIVAIWKAGAPVPRGIAGPAV